MRVCKRYFWLLLACLFPFSVWAQEEGISLFVNDGEKVVYNVYQDVTIQRGTISDALQNVPGVKVDTEGNISLRGVSQVEVWIDDRPSHFDDEGQKRYLQQMPAVAVVRIEVITNPSARYTSATDTGIINIITKDKRDVTHMLSVGLQANTSPNISPSVSYLWSNEKLTFSANVKGTFANTRTHSNGWSCSFDTVAQPDANGTIMQILDTSNYTIFNQRESEDNYDLSMMFKLDYAINEKNDFSTYLNLTPKHSKGNITTDTWRKEYINEIGEYRYGIENQYQDDVVFGSVGAYFQHRFEKEGHNLSINLNSDFDDGDVRHAEKRTYHEIPHMNRDIQKRDMFTDIGWDVKVDYNLPLANTTDLYLGFVNVFHPDNNIDTYDTLDFSTNLYWRDTLRSEHRRFNTNQTEGLIILQQHFGNLTLRPGVSYNVTRLKATYFDTPEYNMLRFVPLWKPSLHLTYRTDSGHNFSLSYTRKTTFAYVRNFTNRINYSEDSFGTGNPDLKPTLTDVFEGGWARYWDKFGSVGVKGYYKNSKDAINTVSESRYDPLFGRAVTFTKPYNVGKFSETGVECNITYRPNAMFNLRMEANVFDSYLRTKFNDEVEQNEMLCYNLRLNAWTKLWDKLELMGTAYYNSPTQTLYAIYQTAYGINCGVHAEFFNNRLSVMLNANDIFNWNKEDNNIFSPTYISYTTSRTNSRYVSMEVIYKVL